MQSAIEQFRDNLARTRNQLAVYRFMKSQVTSVLDLSDLLRGALVMAVSALDLYVHEVIRLGMLEIHRGVRPDTSTFLRFQISMGAVRRGLQTLFPDDWLDGEIRIQHTTRTFQRPDRIADGIHLISDVSLWESVASIVGLSSQDIKLRLNLIIDRRNQIAHEADRQSTVTGDLWPIDEILVADAIDFIERITEAMHQINIQTP